MLVTAAALLGACSETVALGSECPAFALECLDDPGDGDGDGEELDAGEPLDAGGESDASMLEPDAGPGEDAGPEPISPGLENGSFAITSDPPTPGEVGPLFGTRIDPWLWCAGRVEVNSTLGGYAPTEGDSLIGLSFGVGPARLGQVLAMPLRANQPYALAVDVGRSEDGGELRLDLRASNDLCDSGDRLAQTEPLTGQPPALVTHCLRFTPARDYTSVTLGISGFNLVGTVYVDNLRFDPACL
jgi:hypothetical protein